MSSFHATLAVVELRFAPGFLIAAVALTCRNFLLCVVSDVLRERASNLDDVVKLPFLVTSYEALVFASIDQLSLASLCFCRHIYLLHINLKFRYDQAGTVSFADTGTRRPLLPL